MNSTGVERVLRKQRLVSLRAGSLLRVGVVTIMVSGALIHIDPARWPAQAVLLSVYLVITVGAVLVAFSAVSYSFTRSGWLLAFAAADIAAIVGFKLLSPGGYIPILVMVLLPRMLAVDMSWRRVGIVLALSFGVFTASVLQDPVITSHTGPATGLILLMYGFMCATGFLAAFFRSRQVGEMAQLTLSREELLGQIMTASEEQRRQIAESIHDGPLQDVLAARRDIADFLKVSPAQPLEYAVASLADASRRLREVTFELHPTVLDEVGLVAAVEKLVAVTADRSGIVITAALDHWDANPMDPLLFGVIRELLANVARHSRANTASVKLAVIDRMARLDVTDNGIGISRDVAARRLAQGHIGLASHRARVEAAGGMMSIIDEPVGAHIRVELPV